MKEFNWIEMMEYMQEIRLFSSTNIQRTKKGQISSSRELDLLSRLVLTEEIVTPHSLSVHMGVEKSVISRLIEGLVKKGFIEKEYSMEDKRSYHLKMTEEGRKELEHTYSYYLGPVYKLREHLGENDFHELIRLIHNANQLSK